MKEPEWIELDVVFAIHEAQLAEHGGALGVRDRGLLESALARPQNLYSYAHGPDTTELAAMYAAGITRNHPFLDGNKRVGWLLCALFLELNGFEVIADQAEVAEIMLALAAGALEDQQIVDWLKRPNVTRAASRKRHA